MKISAMLLAASFGTAQPTTTSTACDGPLSPCELRLLSAGLRCAKQVDDLEDQNASLRLDLADARKAVTEVAVPPRVDEGGVPAWLFWTVAVLGSVAAGAAIGVAVIR